MRVSELTRRSGASADRLRHDETRGLIHAERSRSGCRQFAESAPTAAIQIFTSSVCPSGADGEGGSHADFSLVSVLLAPCVTHQMRIQAASSKPCASVADGRRRQSCLKKNVVAQNSPVGISA